MDLFLLLQSLACNFLRGSTDFRFKETKASESFFFRFILCRCKIVQDLHIFEYEENATKNILTSFSFKHMKTEADQGIFPISLRLFVKEERSFRLSGKKV